MTGGSGTIGIELIPALRARGVTIVAVERRTKLLESDIEVVTADVSTLSLNLVPMQFDAIVHAAGDVSFQGGDMVNTKMMEALITVALEKKVPILYVSTAFLFRPEGERFLARNAYEYDKYVAEERLCTSGVPHTIFRPSVMVGHSETGAIQNFSGYYVLVKKFYEAGVWAREHHTVCRVPQLLGTSNMVPVDQAAQVIADSVLHGPVSGVQYVTNPAPPRADFVLTETLRALGMTVEFSMINVGFPEYEQMSKNTGEELVGAIGKHMHPYWSLEYQFPPSLCTVNYITGDYIQRAVQYYRTRSALE